MDKIKLTIDGREVEVAAGATVLEAAKLADIYIPTLCAHPDLEPYGGCRLCMVEIEKMRGMPTACTTPATNGMVVRTDTQDIKWLRQMVLQEILSDHPGECLACDRKEQCKPNDVCPRNVSIDERCITCAKNGQCELQNVVNRVGMGELALPRSEREFPLDDSNPFFEFDRRKCILCARCVRTCDEITCVGAIELAYRSFETRVATASDKPFFESICQSCGECVVRCPTAALTPKKCTLPTSEVSTTCPYCGVGCQMYLGVSDGHVVSVRGSYEGSNRGKLCVKGRFGIVDFVHSPERLTKPLIKENGEFKEASWEQALDLIASRLPAYNPQEIGVISSSRTLNEDNYVAQKFARAVLGTNNVDNCARV
jgi:predicted molibdopterin-dependent oxidoreductase YjgC